MAQSGPDALVSMPYDEMVADLHGSKIRLEEGLKQAEASNIPLVEAELLGKLSTVTYLLGEHELSLRHGLKAIALFEKSASTAKAGSMYCSLGYQMKRRDMAKANAYMQHGIGLLEALNDTNSLEAAYNNYGVLKEMEGALDSATIYYERAFLTAKGRNDSIALPFSLNHLAGVELLRKNFAEAQRLFTEAYSIRLKRNDRFGILENVIFKGDVFSAMMQTDSAIHSYQEAIRMSYKVGFPYMRQYCFEQLSIIYERTGRTALALTAQRSYSALKDSLLDQQRTEHLAEMETRFETTQKEKENLLLKQRTQEQQLVVSRQRTWIFGLLGAALTIVFLSLFILQRNKRREESKRDAAIIEERERGLRSIIQATEEERKRIAKDLHDGIVQTLTGLSLRMQRQANSKPVVEMGLKDELNATRSTLDEAISEVRDISHQMMPRALNELGLIPAMEDMLRKSLGMTEIAYEFEHHNMEGQRFKETLEISLYRICQELINNIIKHSEAKAVSVQLLKTKSHLILVVEDNGKGFVMTDSDTRNGIGLMNINSRAKAIHGEVNYEPSPLQGTVATIRVPLD